MARAVFPGYLKLTFGCMTAGKTDYACKTATLYADLEGLSVLYVNTILDERETVGGENSKFTSHSSSNKYLSEKVATARVKCLRDLKDYISYDVIVIDEGQFFPDLIDVVMEMVEGYHKHVEVVGLDGDFQRRPFGKILELIPKADDVIKLNARCGQCVKQGLSSHDLSSLRKPAPFSKKISGSDDLIEIGGGEKYIAVCRYHYLNS
ncbi:Thymidine kinase [uncultured virus]|nr:Thymidine kinase [uncultured virus]